MSRTHKTVIGDGIIHLFPHIRLIFDFQAEKVCLVFNEIGFTLLDADACYFFLEFSEESRSNFHTLLLYIFHLYMFPDRLYVEDASTKMWLQAVAMEKEGIKPDASFLFERIYIVPIYKAYLERSIHWKESSVFSDSSNFTKATD